MAAVYGNIQWDKDQNENGHFAAKFSNHFPGVSDWILVQVQDLWPIR